MQVYPIPEEAKDVAARFVDMKNMIEDNEGVRQLDWAVGGGQQGKCPNEDRGIGRDEVIAFTLERLQATNSPPTGIRLLLDDLRCIIDAVSS